MITSLGNGFEYAGIANASTNPGSPEGQVFYITKTPGTYTNFLDSTNAPIVVPQGISILKYNGTYWALDSVLKSGDLINVNDANNQSTAYASSAAARAAVPTELRKPGLQITYLLASGWILDQFISSDISAWTTGTNWQTLGPVSVSQNTETGGWDVQIGSNAPIPLIGVQPGLVRLKTIVASKPAGIKDGEVYYNTTSKELVTYIGNETVVLPYITDVVYAYNNEIYVWNGSDLVRLERGNSVNTVVIGKSKNFSFKYITLTKDRYYKLSIPVFWNVPQGSGECLFLDDTNNNYITDTTGETISYSVLRYHEYLFKAPYSGVYRLGVKAKFCDAVNVIIDDYTILVNKGLNGIKTMPLQQGSIINNANIGQVPTLVTDTDAHWRYADISVNEGEIFYIKGQGGNSARLFSILDNENKVLMKSVINAIKTELSPVLMPTGAKRLTYNATINSACRLCSYNNQESLLSSVIQETQFQNITLYGGLVNASGNVGAKPTIIIETAAGWLYGIVNVVEGQRFVISGLTTSSANYPLYCILDAGGYIIEKEHLPNHEYTDQVITIPNGGAKLVVNIRGGRAYKFRGVLKNNPFGASSPFYKKINYGVVPTNDYVGVGTDYDWGADATDTDAVYTKYDSLINTQEDISDWTQDVNDGYIYRKKIGNASDGQPLLMYEFRPLLSVNETIPKIVVICGQHGFEKNSTFGMWYLLNDVVNNNNNSPVAKYIREFVNLFVIPVANPSGWDISQRVNSNGVDLNRNWAVRNWVKDTEASSGSSGLAPFDQPETQAMRDAILAINDVVLLMDCHQNGKTLVTIANINWIDITFVDDLFYNVVRNSANFEQAAVTRLFRNLYQSEIGGTNEICGYIGKPWPIGKGFADLWAIEQNIIGITHEGFGGFPLGTYMSPTSHKANSELLGNFIKNFCAYYSRLNP